MNDAGHASDLAGVPRWPPTNNPIRLWWRQHVLADVEHVRVVDRVHEEDGWTPRYAFMTLLSAGIALLGLLLASPAVVIGAMLISPLMGPIIGLGFALAIFDWSEIRRTGAALAGGVALAVLFCAAVTLLSPLQNVTSEIAARTRPNLFDLLVALFSALAGTYAMIRGREGTVVGVAIATALMPPLAVVGFGLATLNAPVFQGALLLFFTNLMTIALTAAVMARLYGFGHRLSPRQSMLQTLFILGTFAALAVPLGLALRQIAWETAAEREARDAIAAEFGAVARISQIDVDFDSAPIRVSATVFTPEIRRAAERRAALALGDALETDVAVSIEQLRVGSESEAAQLQSAGGRPSARGTRAAIAERLALVAGASAEAVTVDTVQRRAQAIAAPLPGAGLATYRILEQRAAAATPGWDVRLTPPAAPLPAISFDNGEPEPEALALAIWAGQRINGTIGVAGAAAQRGRVLAALREAGIAAEEAGGGPAGLVTLDWRAPAGDAGPTVVAGP